MLCLMLEKSAVLLYCVYVVVVWVCVTWRSGLDRAAGARRRNVRARGSNTTKRIGLEDRKVATLRINMLRPGNDRSLEPIIIMVSTY